MLRKHVARGGRWSRGQVLAEYALILALVAATVFAGYEKMNKKVDALVKSDYQTVKLASKAVKTAKR